MNLEGRLTALMAAVGADIKALSRPSEMRNASTASQGPGFATDTYLLGSNCAIPAGRLKAGTWYRCKFRVAKTAAGTAAPIVRVRLGTAGGIGDASMAALTFQAQTAAVDEALVEIIASFRSVGAGAAAVLYASGMIGHRLATTGLSNTNTGMADATSAGFDSSVPTSIGLSVNGGASAAWTVTHVQAELQNLT